MRESLKESDLNLENALKLEKYFRPVSLAKSFSHAFYGLKQTIIGERNFRIHTCCAVAALSLAFLLKVDLVSWLILIQVISLVLTTELVNTAIEHLVDLTAGSLYHPIAKAAKDAAAGAVLLSSVFALISGLIIFVPRLLP